METTTTFNDLPTEMKVLIFSYFHSSELNEKVAKVCKNWRYLCCDPYAWRRFRIKGRKIMPEQMIRILNRNQFLHCIEFWSIQDFSWLSRVEKHSCVQKIVFMFCSLSKSTMPRLVDVFPNVERVKIYCCSEFESDVLFQMTRWKLLKSFSLNGRDHAHLSSCIPSFAEKIIHLEKIKLGSCLDFDSRSLNQLIELRGKSLKHLTMSVDSIGNANCQLLASTCIRLKELQLVSSMYMSDQNLLLLMQLPSLQILRIGHCDRIFSANFSRLFNDAKFPNITELLINHCPRFDDSCLKILLTCCPQLTDLQIDDSTKISDEGLQCLPSVCRNLELLICECIQRITEKCLEIIVDQLTQMRCCVTQYCPKINNGKMYKFVDKAKKRMFVRRNVRLLER